MTEVIFEVYFLIYTKNKKQRSYMSLMLHISESR